MPDKQTPNTDNYPKLPREDRQFKGQDEFVIPEGESVDKSERKTGSVESSPGVENPNNDEEVRKP
jgi:hypothetical protein